MGPITSEEFSIAVPRSVHSSAARHCLQHFRARQRQEDLCFALWRPSLGATRLTAMVFELVLPRDGERLLRGNVTLTPAYLERALDVARSRQAGLALLHNHFTPGWQDMSPDDVRAENIHAPTVLSATSLPLVGMTLGTDGAVSARFWVRTRPGVYERRWCAAVRVVGERLDVTHHPALRPAIDGRPQWAQPIGVWGDAIQSRLANLRVGVVGLGSVGRMVSEGLARMGVMRPNLIDYDRIELRNLDRTLGATQADAAANASKTFVAARGFREASTAPATDIREYEASVVEQDGCAAALDCDVLFSCVDRPWPRRVLNHLAYAHLIPVIDGGIGVRMNGLRVRGIEWSLRTVGPDRRCLQCARAYSPGLVEPERKGDLDDPRYLEGLPPDHQLRHNENVFAFSMCLAGQELLQFVALVTGLLSKPNLGDQRFYYNASEMYSLQASCVPDCLFQQLIATGDSVFPGSAYLGEDLGRRRLLNRLRGR